MADTPSPAEPVNHGAGTSKSSSLTPDPGMYIRMSDALKTRGSLTRDEEYNYSQLAASCLAKNIMTNSQREFLEDYVRTSYKLKQQKNEVKIVQLDRELYNLPTSMSNSIKLNELVIRPEVFDGEWPKPRKWISDFNEAILMNGWSDKIAIRYMPTFLKGAAKDWYLTEIRPNIRPETKWAQVHSSFADNYLGEQDYLELSRAIERSNQRPGEKAANFIPRMRRLLQLLKPDISESELVMELRKRFRDEYLRLAHLHPCKTVTELKEWCSRIEAGFLEKQRREVKIGNYISSRSRSNSPAPRPRWTHETHGSLSRAKPAATQRSREPTSDYRKSSRVTFNKVESCEFCSKKGHRESECWTKYPGKRPKRNQINALADDEYNSDSSEEVQTIDHRYEETINRLFPKNILHIGRGGEFIRCDVKCNGKNISAVIDSGAKMSVFDKSLVERYKWEPNGPLIPLCGPNGQSLGINRAISLRVEIRIGSSAKLKSIVC